MRELTELTRAATKLVRSEAHSRMRKNARSTLRKTVRSLLKAYPLDGVQRSGAVVCCPLCKAPMRTWKSFREHFATGHLGMNPGTSITGRGTHDPIRRQISGDTCPACKEEFGKHRTREPHPIDPLHSRDKIYVQSNVTNTRGVEKHLQLLHQSGKLTEHLILAKTKQVYSV